MLGVLDVPDVPGVLGVSEVLRDELGATVTGIISATHIMLCGIHMFSILHFRLR